MSDKEAQARRTLHSKFQHLRVLHMLSKSVEGAGTERRDADGTSSSAEEVHDTFDKLITSGTNEEPTIDALANASLSEDDLFASCDAMSPENFGNMEAFMRKRGITINTEIGDNDRVCQARYLRSGQSSSRGQDAL